MNTSERNSAFDVSCLNSFRPHGWNLSFIGWTSSLEDEVYLLGLSGAKDNDFRHILQCLREEFPEMEEVSGKSGGN